MRRNVLFIIKIISFSLFGLVIVSYSLFQSWKLISGPIIDIDSPQNGTTYNQALVQISGRARNIAYLNLNDNPIFTDKDGNFKEKFLLSPGYNVIKLDAQDKFKTRREKILQIILKEY